MTASLNYKTILRFWSPLAGAWLLMAAEGPLIAAIIARMGNPALDLAAYGVAYAFALVAEAPVLMLMSAATSLVRERQSYEKLRRFAFVLSLGVSFLLMLLALPAVFTPFGNALIRLDPAVTERARLALVCLVPWPAAIGIRRFYQGVLIRNGATRRVALGTTVRFCGMAGSALLLFRYSPFDGATIGGAALSAGVLAEAAAVRLLAGDVIATVLSRDDAAGEDLSLKRLCAFYFPLAMTPVLALSVQPLVTFALGRALFPVESLAVTPVVNGLTFVFRALGLSYQEVAIALMGERFAHYRRLRNFGLWLGCGATLPLILLAATPLADLWFSDVAGLPPELISFALPPLAIQAILPALTLTQSLQRAVLLEARVTAAISLATALETATIALILAALILWSPLTGATIAALAMVAGRVSGVLLLARPNRQVLAERTGV